MDKQSLPFLDEHTYTTYRNLVFFSFYRGWSWPRDGQLLIMSNYINMYGILVGARGSSGAAKECSVSVCTAVNSLSYGRL